MSRDDKNLCVGRFAPTPSGEMHLGNLLCALLAYLSAKSKGGRFLVRIEDLDTARCSGSSADKILDTLHKLGLDSDEVPLRQSERTGIYFNKETELREKVNIYPCFCTRAQLHAAEAPRLSDGEFIYTGVCKNLSAVQVKNLREKRSPCYRIEVPDEDITFYDGLNGEITQNLKRECGDFIMRRSDGVYAYQFAVCVDDGESGITEVVRGTDLLSSTPRQIYLLKQLGYTPPQYYHIPLVCASDGRKLSKSEGDSAYRAVCRNSAEKILGLLAYSCGLIDSFRPTGLDELTENFSWDKIKRSSVYLPEIGLL